MWKWIAGSIVGVIAILFGLGLYLKDQIYPRFAHAETRPADFARTYTPEQLRSDFSYMTQEMAHVHPDLAAITDRDEYERRKRDILQRLDRPMTRVEFFRITGEINGALHDGHTLAVMPREEWDAFRIHRPVAPILVRLDQDGIVITRGLGDLKLPAGSQLVSLNGVDASSLLRAVAPRVSGETPAYRLGFAAQVFARLVWEIGIQGPYVIAYRAPGAASVTTVTTSGVPFAAWDAAQGHPDGQPYRLTIKNGVATIAITDFDSTLYAQIRAFLKDSFRSIQADHVNSLILDFRQCDGGDTRLSDELQTYLSDNKLPAIDSVTVKATPEVKAMYRTLMPEHWRWIPINRMIPQLAGIQDAPDNGTYVDHPEAASPSKRMFANPLAFAGDLYLLVDSNTYSTCLIAAAPYKRWKRAVLIGSPTGEGLTFFGDYYQFDLPNTKLQARASHKLFKLVGSRGADQPLQPDIAVSAARPDALAIALDEIARKHGRPN